MFYFFRCRDLTHELGKIYEAESATDDGRHGRFTTAQNVRSGKLRESYHALPGLLSGLALGPVILAFLTWTYQRWLSTSCCKSAPRER